MRAASAWMALSCIACAGCGDGQAPAAASVACHDEVRERWAFVPFAFDAHDEIEIVATVRGCRLTTITHFVRPERPPAAGGHLPIGFYERQCQWDACDGPPDRPGRFDPYDVRLGGDLVPRLADGTPLTPER
jgi:hypothetical protein